eukprot:2692696-Prymnesium_polylepis.2
MRHRLPSVPPRGLPRPSAEGESTSSELRRAEVGRAPRRAGRTSQPRKASRSRAPTRESCPT